jgi:hypothetical protein
MRSRHHCAGWTIVACVMAPASATAAGQVLSCRQQGVEMIVGGAAAVQDCIPLASHPTVAISPTPAPERVTVAQQRDRDQDRRAILETELARERQQLEWLRRQGDAADGASLSRTQSNLAALSRELARLPR